MRFSLAVLLVCIASAVAFAAAKVDIATLDARSDGDNITVEWRADVEQDVERYEVQRSVQNTRNFKSIGDVDAIGAGSYYRYVDENAFMKGEQDQLAGTMYFYRLKVVAQDGSTSYTSHTPVTHTVSSVRQTWGMIKEMFR